MIHASGWEQLIHATHPHFFTMRIYKHCFLPMPLVFAMKCCTNMPCLSPHNHYWYSLPFLHLYACLPHLLTSTPTACPPSWSSVLCWCLLIFFVIFIFSYFCDMLHFFVTPFWLVYVHIFFRSSFNCLSVESNHLTFLTTVIIHFVFS